jgi:hypothetical protein
MPLIPGIPPRPYELTTALEQRVSPSREAVR